MWWHWLFWWRPPCILRLVIVNLKSGDAIQGVLWQSRGAWLTLREPYALTSAQPPKRMDGDAVIHRAQVDFLQVLPS
jgi:hypothetical protein